MNNKILIQLLINIPLLLFIAYWVYVMFFKKTPLKKLLFARVLVVPIEGDEIHKGSLIIPAESEDTPRYGRVVDVGTKIKHCKVGDTILWRRDAGDEILIDNVVHLIMNEADVIAITN